MVSVLISLPFSEEVSET